MCLLCRVRLGTSLEADEDAGAGRRRWAVDCRAEQHGSEEAQSIVTLER